MNTIAEGARKKSEEQATKELANDKKFRTFMKFLIDHQPDGMKKYANAKGYRRDTFLELARAKQILPGDMIGFYRKKLYSTIKLIVSTIPMLASMLLTTAKGMSYIFSKKEGSLHGEV